MSEHKQKCFIFSTPGIVEPYCVLLLILKRVCEIHRVNIKGIPFITIPAARAGKNHVNKRDFPEHISRNDDSKVSQPVREEFIPFPKAGVSEHPEERFNTARTLRTRKADRIPV